MRSRGIIAAIMAAGLPLTAMAQTLAPEAGSPTGDPVVTAPDPEALRGTAQSSTHRIDVPMNEEVEQAAIMTIDQERLFLSSDWGQRMQHDLEELGQALAAENERLADEFAQEENELTRLRDTLTPQEFRARAEAFDKRVVEVRRERDSKTRELQQRADQERNAFYQAALPVLGRIMHERGALVVLDQRMIFVSADKIDVTQELITRINQEVGPGQAPEDQIDAPLPPSDEGDTDGVPEQGDR